MIPPLVKALQLQALILQHQLSHRPALICAWIGGCLQSRLSSRS
jgi:hypothetical protein